MFEDKHANMLGNMIAGQARDEAVSQAQAEVDALEVLITKELSALGVNILHTSAAYKLIAEVRECRINNLVHTRLQAVADALMAPAGVRVTVSGGPGEMRSIMPALTNGNPANGKVTIKTQDGQIIRTQA